MVFWLRKYTPNKSTEVLCEGDIEIIHEWFQNFAKGVKQSPLLIVGLTGIGKTTLIKLLAKENNLTIMHIPTLKDIPPKSMVTGKIIYHISVYKIDRFFLERILRLVDERISVSSDENIIVETISIGVPIETVENHFTIAYLRYPFLDNNVVERLRDIAKNEGLEVNDEILKDVVQHCGYDIRCSVKMLELVLKYKLFNIKEISEERSIYHSLCDIISEYAVKYFILLIIRNQLKRLAILNISEASKFIEELNAWKQLVETARRYGAFDEILHWSFDVMFLYQVIADKLRLKLKEEVFIDELIHTIRQELNYTDSPLLL